MTDLTNLLLGMHNDEDIRENYIRAPFGYPGGKADYLERILPELPHRKKYCEPFGGSAAILLARQPSPFEVYNDRYGGVVAFYRCLRDKEKMNALIDRLEFFRQSREEFIWCRDTWKDCEDDIERASRWYYMHQLSFANLGRNFARKLDGKRNSMFDKFHNNIKRFGRVHNRLKNVLIENQDWRVCLREFDSRETVFFIDPPYYDTFTTYKHDMRKNEHAELLERISHLSGFVALCGYANDLYDDPKWKWDHRITWGSTKTLRASVNTNTNNNQLHETQKKITEEVLWIKE